MLLFVVNEVDVEGNRNEVGMFENRADAVAVAKDCARYPDQGVVGCEVEPLDGGENVYHVCDSYDITDDGLVVWHGDLRKI